MISLWLSSTVSDWTFALAYPIDATGVGLTFQRWQRATIFSMTVSVVMGVVSAGGVWLALRSVRLSLLALISMLVTNGLLFPVQMLRCCVD